MKKKLSLQKNKQLASNFLRGPFTDTTVVDQNGEKSTQQSHSTQNGHTYGFNFFLKDKFASAAAHTYASACVGHGPCICVRHGLRICVHHGQDFKIIYLNLFNV